MSESSLTRDRIRVRGMTCTSCEVIIERQLKTLPGVKRVIVNHTTGWCTIEHNPAIKLYLRDIKNVLHNNGYQLWSEPVKSSETRQHHWREFGVALLAVFVVYKLLQTLGVFTISTEVDTSINLGAIFVIGLVAAVSTCTALVSGLIISVSAKYNAVHQASSKWQRLKPHIMFNVGRLVSYFILGGLVGLLGNVLTPSARFTGVLTILISLVMMLLAIDILKLFEGKRFIPTMPKWFSQKMYQLAETNRPWVPFALGALTFFLPCGFTQSMQLYALTTGSFWQGGLTMLVFALGTMPALLGVGMLASFAKGKFARYFMKFSGAMVLVLGLYNFNNGLALADIRPGDWFASSATTTVTEDIELVDGKQIINMAVNGISYTPDELTIKQGVPVEWHIDGSNAQGCARIITIPSMGVTKQLSTTTDNIITFTAESAGRLNFSCTMGMARGSFNVIP